MFFSFVYNFLNPNLKIELGSNFFFFQDPQTLDLTVYELSGFNAEILAQEITAKFNIFTLTANGKQLLEAMNLEDVTASFLRSHNANKNSSAPFKDFQYIIKGAEFKGFYIYYQGIIKQVVNGAFASLPVFGHETSSTSRTSIRPFDTATLQPFQPVDCKFIKTDETIAASNNGTITATIENAENGKEYQISIDNGTTYAVAPLSNGKPTLSFSNLAPNSYQLVAKETIVNKKSVLQEIEIQLFETV